MTVKTSYFDGLTYAAADDVAPWAALLSDGVHNVPGGGFAVAAHSPNNLSVDVSAGQAVKNGYFISSDAVANVAIAANTSGYNRIDNIVLNVDTTNKVTTVTVQQGTPSSAPTAPVPAANQLVLAQVSVGNNVSVINSGNISDARVNVDLTFRKSELIFATRDISVASTQTITGLSGKPKRLDIKAAINGGSFLSVGSWESSNNAQAVSTFYRSSTGTPQAGSSNTVAISCAVDQANSNNGTIQNVKIGQFDINWAKTGAPTGTVNLQITAHY